MEIIKTTTKPARDLLPGDQVINGERSFEVVRPAQSFEHFLLDNQVRVWGATGTLEGWVEFNADYEVTIKAL